MEKDSHLEKNGKMFKKKNKNYDKIRGCNGYIWLQPLLNYGIILADCVKIQELWDKFLFIPWIST